MKLQNSHKRISSTYLISLTDVIFLLLIFLMLASNFITQTGINVRLPGSSSGVQHNFKTIEIVYNQDRQIILDNIQMDAEMLKTILPAYFVSNEQVIRLISDKEVSLQEIIAIMDIIRNTGFEKITIATFKINLPTDEN
ncbi:MAG: biopolymer transporter ExbD [Candidatus Cloacimonadaceae bacterium]